MVNICEIIRKKRDGKELTEEEVKWLVQEISNNGVAECQLGAIIMAMYIRGMTSHETAWLTNAMMYSGHVMSWPAKWAGLVVDKHSTGGVGDKTSLILVPALAALGLKVPMISGRGLEITGGTLDKLESIPGYSVNFTPEEITSRVTDVGCCIVGQTEDLVPADKKMYRTRDVTSTVDSIPLIVGSIMSKKLAERPDALVLEVTYGSAAFMKTEEQARRLAQDMIDTGTQLGVHTSALLIRMDRPIGRMVGNSLEVVEAVECMNGRGADDLENTVCQLGGELLNLVGKAKTREEGNKKILATLRDGSAMKKFSEMIQAQGVSRQDAGLLCESPRTLLPLAEHTTLLLAPETGYVTGMDALLIGRVSHKLGAGRSHPDDAVNMGVGLELHVQIGDQATKGAPWVTVYHDGAVLQPELKDMLERAITINVSRPSNVNKETITGHMTGSSQ